MTQTNPRPKLPPQQAVKRQSKAVQLLMGGSGTKTSGNKPGYGKLNSEPQKFNINKPKSMNPVTKQSTKAKKPAKSAQVGAVKKMMGKSTGPGKPDYSGKGHPSGAYFLAKGSKPLPSSYFKNLK